jgi:hypothetical protein
MLSVFPFVYDKLWDGIASEDQGIFKIEFKRNCENLSEKDFKKWMANDYSFFSVIHMTSEERFYNFQKKLKSQSKKASRISIVDDPKIIPSVEFKRLFTSIPHVLDIMSFFVFNEHMNLKKKTEHVITALKHRIPFKYRWVIVRTYTYTEKKYRTRVSRTISFNRTPERWEHGYPNGIDVVFDINKLFSTTGYTKYSPLDLPFHIGYAIQVLEHIEIPLDVILLCMHYER